MEEHLTDNDDAGMPTSPPQGTREGQPYHDTLSAPGNTMAGTLAQHLDLMTEEEFWNYAHEQAKSISSVPVNASTGRGQSLECELSRGKYLIPLRSLREVVSPPYRFAVLPAIPSWMLGITAWRGETIAVIDLDAYLHGATDRTTSAHGEGMLLIANHTDLTVGLFISTAAHEQTTGYPPGRSLPLIDVPMLLTDVVQQIGMTARHG